MMPVSLVQKVLAFDTATQRGSVALLEGKDVRAELRLHSSQTHSTLLLGSIRFLLDRLNWTLNDLTLVASGIGPGSFTGIRIGIATALGFSQSLSIPFVGISGLDALAHQAEMLNGRIGVMLNAHRMQVFYAEYANDNGRIKQCQKSELLPISDLERRLANRHLYIVGELEALPANAVRELSDNWPRPVMVDLFLASAIGRLALSRKNRWRSGDFMPSEPMYIRPPDALKNRRGKR
jgi:tRNA threonylcarbamoyladenosine biosynthesis protein TsaB